MPLVPELFQFVLQIGIGAIILAVLNAFFNRKDRAANPAKTLVESNALFTAEVRRDYDRISVENDRLGTRVSELEKELGVERRKNRNHELLAVEHTAWDRQVVARFVSLGVTDVPDPPRLHSIESEGQ